MRNAIARRHATCAGAFVLTSAIVLFLSHTLRADVLVLQTGRVAEGTISESPGGYMIDMPSGAMLVPFAQVKLRANSRLDAYDKLKAEQRPNSPTDRVALARWCLSQQILDKARADLQEALRLDPERKDAADMLARLEDLLNRDSRQSNVEVVDAAARENLGPPAESLAGLPKEQALHFVRAIEPILINKCGNAACHGPSAGNAFQLEILRTNNGTRRASAERNLAATLNYITVDRPATSPLLAIPKTNHGKNGQSIFRGSAGTRQLEQLEVWVKQVARERRGGQLSPDSGTSLTSVKGFVSPRGDSAEASLSDQPNRHVDPRGEFAEDDLGREIAGPDEQLPPVKPKSNDAFDPDAFNNPR